jgi:hypothetical protein
MTAHRPDCPGCAWLKVQGEDLQLQLDAERERHRETRAQLLALQAENATLLRALNETAATGVVART